MRGVRNFNMAGIRWAFRFSDWQPTVEEWTVAGQSVQAEERDRISRFVFRRDAKSAMAGRLLLRKVIHEELGIAYDGILLKRTEKGKPFLANEMTEKQGTFNFNVSHQGDFAVLAAQRGHLVGVDVMKVDEPRGTRLKEFFDRMSRQFTKQEWSYITSDEETHNQLSRFYRLWCLKESYVKALGIGIGFELQRIDFHVKTPSLSLGERSADTKLHADGRLQDDWTFEETRLKDNHYVAVATRKVPDDSGSADPVGRDVPEFSFLTFQELIRGAEAQTEPDLHFWQNFQTKAEKPGG